SFSGRRVWASIATASVRLGFFFFLLCFSAVWFEEAKVLDLVMGFEISDLVS
ncbi:hypothetical protein AALP_AAs66564U000100, partial [Arabis alpina]